MDMKFIKKHDPLGIAGTLFILWGKLLDIYFVSLGFITIWFMSENAYDVENIIAVNTLSVYTSILVVYIVLQVLHIFWLEEDVTAQIKISLLYMGSACFTYLLVLAAIQINLKLILCTYAVIYLGGKILRLLHCKTEELQGGTGSGAQ